MSLVNQVVPRKWLQHLPPLLLSWRVRWCICLINEWSGKSTDQERTFLRNAWCFMESFLDNNIVYSYLSTSLILDSLNACSHNISIKIGKQTKETRITFSQFISCEGVEEEGTKILWQASLSIYLCVFASFILGMPLISMLFPSLRLCRQTNKIWAKRITIWFPGWWWWWQWWSDSISSHSCPSFLLFSFPVDVKVKLNTRNNIISSYGFLKLGKSQEGMMEGIPSRITRWFSAEAK